MEVKERPDPAGYEGICDVGMSNFYPYQSFQKFPNFKVDKFLQTSTGSKTFVS